MVAVAEMMVAAAEGVENTPLAEGAEAAPPLWRW